MGSEQACEGDTLSWSWISRCLGHCGVLADWWVGIGVVLVLVMVLMLALVLVLVLVVDFVFVLVSVCLWLFVFACAKKFHEFLLAGRIPGLLRRCRLAQSKAMAVSFSVPLFNQPDLEQLAKHIVRKCLKARPTKARTEALMPRRSNTKPFAEYAKIKGNNSKPHCFCFKKAHTPKNSQKARSQKATSRMEQATKSLERSSDHRILELFVRWPRLSGDLQTGPARGLANARVG